MFLVFIVGLMLSAISAWYSIIGLTTIFSGAFWAVFIMGSALEIAKIVTAAWLYRMWDNIHILMRCYFISAVTILMLITSVGVFGFLSNAHIQHGSILIESRASIDLLIQDLSRHNSIETGILKQLSRLDYAVDKLVEMEQVTKATQLKNQQTAERVLLKRELESIQNESALSRQKLKIISAEMRKSEIEVGPIRYVAELVYNTSNTEAIDKAVRLIIILLVIVFDPLAILLIIASSIIFHATIIKKPYRGKRSAAVIANGLWNKTKSVIE